MRWQRGVIAENLDTVETRLGWWVDRYARERTSITWSEGWTEPGDEKLSWGRWLRVTADSRAGERVLEVTLAEWRPDAARVICDARGSVVFRLPTLWAALRAQRVAKATEAGPEPPSATPPPGEQGQEVEVKPSWFPKKPTTLKQWTEAYGIIFDMREEAADPEKWDADSLPLLEEYRERLKERMNWYPKVKTVGRIRQAGDRGWLKKPKR